MSSPGALWAGSGGGGGVAMGGRRGGKQSHFGAAWRGLKAPAEAALEMVGIHARRVDAARQRGKVVPGAVELAGFGNRGGGGAARRGRRMRRHEEGNGSRGRQGSLSAHQSAARAAGGPGNRWRGGAARTPAMMEVEDDWED